MLPSSKLVTWVSVILIPLAIAANLMGFISEPIMVFVLGVFGYSGVAGFRAWIDSQGWRSYFLGGVAVAGVGPYLASWITMEQLVAWLTVWGIATVAALVAAFKKVPAGAPKLKKAVK